MRLRSSLARMTHLLLFVATSACGSESAPETDLDALVNPGPGRLQGPSTGTIGVGSNPLDSGIQDASDADVATDGSFTVPDSVNAQERTRRALLQALTACRAWCQLNALCYAAADAFGCQSICERLPATIDGNRSQSADVLTCAESIRDAFVCTQTFDCEDVYDVQAGFSHDCTQGLSDANTDCRALGVPSLMLPGLN